MPVNPEVKGTLAKLLATENLNVEHRAVSTAYFEIENRTLCLPIWKDVSGTVYDLLVGHEVGHALYTPLDYGDATKQVPHDIINVLEDVRVEKLMKRRYPGLSKSFLGGYNELNMKNFFDIEGKNVSKLSLIDRINLHFKIGVIVNRTIIPFEPDEQQWINRAADTETFDDVVSLGIELVEYLKLKNSENDDTDSDIEIPPNFSGNSDKSDVTENVGPSSSTTQEEGGTTQERGSTTQERGETTSRGGKGLVDEFKSETYQSMDENQELLVDKNAKSYLYVNIPKINLSNIIVPYNKIDSDFQSWVVDAAKTAERSISDRIASYREYKKNSIKTVNYIVKEFECKKAADQYYRANTSRTGVLNTQKLHTYKFSDDIFKKITTIPDSKNHGLVFYLDWSGSMASTILATLKQLYDLVWFCKKVSIPFRVYAFSDNSNNFYWYPGDPSENKAGDLNIDPNFRLFEFLSSKMNTSHLDSMMENLYVHCSGANYRDYYNYRFEFSGTPLVETIVTTPQVVEVFQSQERVQKVNVIYLTDGEACEPMYNNFVESMNNVYAQPICSPKSICVLKDPKTRYQTQVSSYSKDTTNEFIKFISNIVDYNLLGFRLCSKYEINTQLRYSNQMDKLFEYEKMWTKNKCVAISNCGFDELYLMHINMKQNKGSSFYDDDTFEDNRAKTTAQYANQFKKLMGAKMNNKTILSKFVGQIA